MVIEHIVENEFKVKDENLIEIVVDKKLDALREDGLVEYEMDVLRDIITRHTVFSHFIVEHKESITAIPSIVYFKDKEIIIVDTPNGFFTTMNKKQN